MKTSYCHFAALLVLCGTTLFAAPNHQGHHPVLPIAPDGFNGAVLPLERAVPALVAKASPKDKTIRLTAWRGETVNAQCAVWTREPVRQLRFNLSVLKASDGKVLDASPRAAFVSEVQAKGAWVPDIADTLSHVNLTTNGYRAVWYWLAVPRSAVPGTYRGTVDFRAADGKTVTFPIELQVLSAALPEKNDFFLDLWQHPFAVARYHDVTPFSPEHYALMEPIWRELASAGQRTITVSIQDLPWGHQNYDPYWNFIKIERDSKGNFSYDFSRFDEYVEFAHRCGLGPDIHCYSIVTWGNRHFYYDKETGDHRYITAVSGSPEHTAFWTPFLKAFERHVVAKGWGDCTYIALDERSLDETKAALNLIQRVAPRLKLSMACNRPPRAFAEYRIDDFCVVLNHVDPAYEQEAQARAKKGFTSTYYVCCSPARPNTFTTSPLHDGIWLGVYAAAHRLSGFLRWAFVNWPKSPRENSDFGNWPTGDTYLFYPNNRPSLRWLMLKDGIEEARKLNHIRSIRPDLVDGMRKVLGMLEYKRVEQVSDEQIGADVAAIRLAIEKAARGLPAK
ncbi:MAG: DUF6067 family protein [Kiritimatiellia bacterium]|nr:DUF6067 family protein [Kiritimatiellia bacterium]